MKPTLRSMNITLDGLDKQIKLVLGEDVYNGLVKAGIPVPRMHDMAIREVFVKGCPQANFETEYVLKAAAVVLGAWGWYELGGIED